MSADVLLTFIAASALLGLAPGPDNLFVLAQSALHGRRAGLFVTLGLCTGLLGHTMAVALGLAAIFATSALVFTLVKIVGAGYLLYLAWGAFRSSTASSSQQDTPRHSDAVLYRRGILMNLSNPKVALFFLAFLPQFADPAKGSLTLQLIMLGLVFIVVTLVVFSTVALLSARLTAVLRASAAPRLWLNRITGVLFVGLALRLLTTTR